MAESDSGQERTEQATPKRQNEAREQGQIPRSKELNTMAVLLAGSGGLLVLGEGLVGRMVESMRAGLTLERAEVFDPAAMSTAFSSALWEMLVTLAPLLSVLVAAAIVGAVAIGGVSFSGKALAPKLSKLDPLKGLGRVFGMHGLMELAKALAKFVVVAGVAVFLMIQLAPELLGLGDEPLEQGLRHAASIVAWTFLALSAVLVLIAGVDVPFQLWQHAKQLRMTRQEIKDEFKETEGRPEVKGKIRQMQREIARRRMMEEVPNADVVVTNPTHFAVALKYDRKMRAPKVVAKGVDLVAANIRGVAETNRVPMFEAPPLARALYWSTELGEEIPAGLYVAVAQVLAYVYQVKNAARGGGVAPVAPEDLPVPPEFLKRDRPAP